MLKRISSTLLAVLVICTLFTACAKRQDENKPDTQSSESEKVLDLSTMATHLKDNIQFVAQLNEITNEQLSNYYLKLDKADIAQYKVLVSADGGFADEVGLFKASSPQAAANIKKAVDDRIEDLVVSFEDYRPDEMVKINNAVIITDDVYVFYCVTSEYETADQVIRDYIK